MSLHFDVRTHVEKEHSLFSETSHSETLQAFQNIINDPQLGFFHLTDQKEYLAETKKVFEIHANKKYFVQIGIGGSALGPKMLIDSLQKDFSKRFFFFDNVDSDYIQRQLDQINPQDSLFYVVSKSGGTAETTALFAIAKNWLEQNGITELKEHFVLCTDPKKGDLFELAKEYDLSTLPVPSNVGGRFSVFTPVGLLPALFAGIDIDALYEGANGIKKRLLSENFQENPLMQAGAHLEYLRSEKNIVQTIFMPYSSQLKTMADWFVQLWGESLGKVHTNGTNTGLTPIPAYGATDQHSQMQLFMEGPNDKCLFLLDIKERKNNFSLNNNFSTKSFQKLASYSLNQLMEAEFHGTLKALEDNKRHVIHLSLDKNDEQHMGEMVLFFESLTAVMGYKLDINAFNQPGVEKGKIFAFEYLEKKS